MYFWETVEVMNYSSEQSMWVVSFDDKEQAKVKRLNVCFDTEDPKKFVDRFIRAIVDRIYMDSNIRYNFYINAMPNKDISELSEASSRRIIENARNTRKLKEAGDLSVDVEIDSLNSLYSRTMNKILFNKYLEDNRDNNLIPNRLIFNPEETTAPEAPPDGMIYIERVEYNYEPKGSSYSYPSSKDFSEVFKEFCLSTIFTKSSAIKGLHEIRMLSDDIKKKDIFNLKFQSEVKMEEFKHAQETSTQQLLYSLKIQWINDIVRIIQNKFTEEDEGWFNLKNANPMNYSVGKLKSFMNLVKLEMQDSLKYLIVENFNNYVTFIQSFIPKEVKITDENDVVNIFENEIIDSKAPEDFKKKIQPFFHVDLKISEKDIVYSYGAQHFARCTCRVFKGTLDELSKIPDIESKVLDNKFKKRIDTFLEAPQLPKTKPIEPDPKAVPKRYMDENAWVWDLYEELEKAMAKAVKP
jgi:dynein heavy chain